MKSIRVLIRIILAVFAILTMAAIAVAEQHAEDEAIKQAVLDYVNAIY
jgi:hypothetical protein